jgi:ribosomal-protein-alanine N-acetyltransferase
MNAPQTRPTDRTHANANADADADADANTGAKAGTEAGVHTECNPQTLYPEVAFAPMRPENLDTVAHIEQTAYAKPWSRSDFADVLQSGHQAQLLVAQSTVLGYFVAMRGVDETHLLNITVAPAFQGQGWAKIMLEALCLWSRAQAAHCIWLEVRAGNARAFKVYAACGFARVGIRKNYYPAAHGSREDAWVMRLAL